MAKRNRTKRRPSKSKTALHLERGFLRATFQFSSFLTFRIMNRLLIGISLLGALALPLAVAPQVNAAPAPTGSIKSAKVTSFLTGLGDPRGLGFKDYKDGGLMVADSATGAILDFALDGKQSLLAQANGLQGPTQIVYLPGGFYFAESKAGRVMQAKFNILAQVGDLINDPVGIVAAGRMDETPYVVSQSGKISHLLPLDNGATERAYVREYGWKTVYEPATPNTPDGIAPAIALAGDNILMTVPATGEVKLIANNGRSSVLARVWANLLVSQRAKAARFMSATKATADSSGAWMVTVKRAWSPPVWAVPARWSGVDRAQLTLPTATATCGSWIGRSRNNQKARARKSAGFFCEAV